MWFGTYNGLSRYDGYEFYNYHYDSTSDSGLPAATINTIIEDNNGFLWLGTDNGLVKFDMKLEKFSRYSCDKKSDSPTCNYINSFLLDDQKIWLGTDKGLYLFNTNTEEIKKINISNSKHKKRLHITSITKSKNGTIWLAAGSRGLIKVNSSDYQWQEFTLGKSGGYDNLIMEVAYHDNLIWIGAAEGLYSFNDAQGVFSEVITNSKPYDFIKNS